jgi:hypothetical protein
MGADASFQIVSNLASGEKFEDVLGQITYTDENFTGKILTAKAYEDYKKSRGFSLAHPNLRRVRTSLFCG